MYVVTAPLSRAGRQAHSAASHARRHWGHAHTTPQLKASFQPNQALGVFPCIIRFEGPNVLEGLCELIPRGATVGRLPKFLATLPEQLTSHLTVTDDDISM